MSDEEGVMHLEDLQQNVDTDQLASRNGANNQYWLFTRCLYLVYNVAFYVIVVKIGLKILKNEVLLLFLLNMYVFFRSNPKNPQIITYGNANSIKNSNYSERRPLKVIVHGWNGSGNSVLNTRITSAFLEVSDVNVIVVDWSALASGMYVTAAAGVPSVGQFIGNFVVWLINTAGGNWDNVHFVGFSLGAHAVGVAGRVTGGRPIRVTG